MLMHAATRLAPRTIAIGLVTLAFLVGSLGIAFVPAAATSSGGATLGTAHPALAQSAGVPAVSSVRAAPAPAAHVVPAAGTTNVTVTPDFALAANSTIPIPYVNFTVMATNASMTNATTFIWVQVYDYTSSTWVTNITLNNTVNATGTNGAGSPVTNGTANGAGYNTSAWSMNLNQTTLGCAVANCSDMLVYHDTYNITVQAIVNGTSDGGTVGQNDTTASTAYVAGITAFSVTFNPSSATTEQYSTIPFEVNYTLAVVNATITPANLTMSVEIVNALTGGVQSTFAVPAVTGQTSYSFWVDDTNLSCPAIDPTCQSITGSYFILLNAQLNGYAAPIYSTVATATSELNTTSSSDFITFLTQPVTVTLLAPVCPPCVVGVGNLTFSLAYTGQVILAANLTVFSPTDHSVAIFSANLLRNPLTGEPSSAVWDALNPGTYPMTIEVSTLYGLSVFHNSSLTVQKTGGGATYVNETNWVNDTTSGILGMSGAAGGTVLLVVGLIVGLIVAMVLGRAVYSRPAAAPAQPWTEAKPTAPNSCSVCGKTFATPEELQAHAKSEHGM